jgi:hypothetical protein
MVGEALKDLDAEGFNIDLVDPSKIGIVLKASLRSQPRIDAELPYCAPS